MTDSEKNISSHGIFGDDTQAIEETYLEMKKSAIKCDIDPNSMEAVFNELKETTASLDRLDMRMTQLETLFPSENANTASIEEFKFPIYKSIEDLRMKLPPGLLACFKREGGTSLTDHIKRVMKKAMPDEVQRQINRTGVNGKKKFPRRLEKMIIESSLFLYSDATVKQCESVIAHLLQGATGRLMAKENRKRERDEEIVYKPPSSRSELSTTVNTVYSTRSRSLQNQPNSDSPVINSASTVVDSTLSKNSCEEEINVNTKKPKSTSEKISADVEEKNLKSKRQSTADDDQTSGNVNKAAKSRSFKCSTCFKEFSQEMFLVLHESVHQVEEEELENENPNLQPRKSADKLVLHDCLFCFQTFTSECELRVHSKRHSIDGYKKYECNLCYKRFPQQNNLQRHKLFFHND